MRTKVSLSWLGAADLRFATGLLHVQPQMMSQAGAQSHFATMLGLTPNSPIVDEDSFKQHIKAGREAHKRVSGNGVFCRHASVYCTC
jgi:hypothetical protein